MTNQYPLLDSGPFQTDLFGCISATKYTRTDLAVVEGGVWGGHYFMNSKLLLKYAVICKTSGIFHQCFCPAPLAKMEDFRMLNFVTAQLIIRI